MFLAKTYPSLWFEAHNFLPIAFFSVFFSQILMKLLLLGVCQRTKFHGEWKVDFGWGDGNVPPLTPAWSILYVTPLRIKKMCSDEGVDNSIDMLLLSSSGDKEVI